MFNANDLRVNDARCHDLYHAADRQRAAHAAQALRPSAWARAFAWLRQARLAARHPAPALRPIPGTAGAQL